MCDLTNEASVSTAIKDADAVIWCVAGNAFSNPVKGTLAKFKQLLPAWLRVGSASNETSEKQGLDLVLEQILSLGYTDTQVAVLSSAAVTRTGWSKEKKERYDNPECRYSWASHKYYAK